MHEILNGLNPRGDGRLLEALGGTLLPTRCHPPNLKLHSELTVCCCARLVAGRVGAHSEPGGHQLRLTEHSEDATTRRE